MSTSTLDFANGARPSNSGISSVVQALFAAVAAFRDAQSRPEAQAVAAPEKQPTLMSLYRLANRSDSVMPEVTAQLAILAARA